MAAAEKRVENRNELYSEDSDNQCPYTTSPRKDGHVEITSHKNETDRAIPNRSIGEEAGKRDVLPDLPNHQRIFVALTSGAVAGAIAKTVIAPLDRTKIYFQTHPDKRYRLKGAWKFMRLTYNNDGVLSLWRGNSATITRIVPYAAIQFMSHDQYKRLFGLSNSTGTQMNVIQGQRTHVLHFLAGSLAGITAGSLTYPLDRARAVMAVTNVGEYKNLMDVFKRAIRDEGYRSLYRGFFPTILGVIPYAGVSFLTYEKLKGLWFQRASGNEKNTDKSGKQFTLSPLWRLLFGAIAGLLGQTVSYPLDIVRRRMQTAHQMGFNGNRYTSIIGTLGYILRKEGVRRGWYKGISMNFIKGPIAVGTSFTVNDYCRMAMGKAFSSNPSSRDK